MRLVKNTMHSNREERKAAAVLVRSRALRARPSTAAQKEVKRSVRGVGEEDEEMI